MSYTQIHEEITRLFYAIGKYSDSYRKQEEAASNIEWYIQTGRASSLYIHEFCNLSNYRMDKLAQIIAPLWSCRDEAIQASKEYLHI